MKHEIAGRVHETPKYDKLNITSRATYMRYLKKAKSVMRPFRNEHSAVGLVDWLRDRTPSYFLSLSISLRLNRL